MPTILRALLLLLVLPLAATAAAADDAGIAAAVRAHLQALATDLPGELELEVLGRPDDTPLAAGEELRIGTPSGRWPRARVAVPVQHWRDGVRVRSRTVWVAVRWWRDVDVYAGDFAAATAADAVRSEVRRSDVAGVDGELQALSELAGERRLRRPVRAGRPLLAADFEAVPDVVRGATVAVEVQRGAISLSTRGRALADGFIGDTIAVALDAGRAPVNTLVISSKAVRIED
jgi:flagella basal body P-ring formation protein FlgA